MDEEENRRDPQDNRPGAETAETEGLRPESPGGAGMTEEGRPIGFTADVGGEPQSTDDPEELREQVPDAAGHGPRQASERRERGDPEDDRPWVG